MSSRIVPSHRGETIAWRRPTSGSDATAAPEDAPASPLDDPPAEPPVPPPPAVDEEQHRQLQARAAELEQKLRATAAEAVAREAKGREAGYAEGLRAGQEQGLAAGREDGIASVRAEAEAAIAAIREKASAQAAATVEQSVELRRRLRQQMEADLVQLAVAIARRILRRELAVDPDALLGIVKSTVERLAARELLTVRVAPADAARLRARLPDLRLPDRVEVIEDPSLTWGALIFDTTRGHYDASVETQIDEIDRGLADLTGRGQGNRRSSATA